MKSAIPVVQELLAPAIGRGMDDQVATLGCKAKPVQLLLHATQLGLEGSTSPLLPNCDDLLDVHRLRPTGLHVLLELPHILLVALHFLLNFFMAACSS